MPYSVVSCFHPPLPPIQIVLDRPSFHCPDSIFPAGYCITRVYGSLHKLDSSCLWTCKISESDDAPLVSRLIHEFLYNEVSNHYLFYSLFCCQPHDNANFRVSYIVDSHKLTQISDYYTLLSQIKTNFRVLHIVVVSHKFRQISEYYTLLSVTNSDKFQSITHCCCQSQIKTDFRVLHIVVVSHKLTQISDYYSFFSHLEKKNPPEM